jgi:linoleoyl-CoA desaturase
MATPKFSPSTHSFHSELKKRINTYFAERGKTLTGGIKIYTKAMVLFAAFVWLYVHLYFLHRSLASLNRVHAAGTCVASSLQLMHDACHGAYQQNAMGEHLAADSLN